MNFGLREENLVCLYCDEGVITELSELPKGIELELHRRQWRFAGGAYTIGHGVRISTDGEPLNGPMFIFDINRIRQWEKAQQIKREITDHGRLIIA